MNIYVTRHGQTNWNVLKKVMGLCDEALNEKGLSQANETKVKLANENIDIIICSPLQRARQTALVINEGRNIPIIYDERIVERNFGEFEGLKISDFDFEGFWDYYKNGTYEKAENIQDFFNRIYDFLENIIKKYQDKNVLIVAHGGVSIPIACYFKEYIPEGSLVNTDLVLDNCEVAKYSVFNKIR